MVKKLGNYKGNDVELCTTTSGSISDETANVLIENHVPFTKIRKHIPFYRRNKNDGNKYVWVITTSPRQYSDARRVLDDMDMFYRQQLVVSNL